MASDELVLLEWSGVGGGETAKAEAQRPCLSLLTQGVDSGPKAVLGEHHSNWTQTGRSWGDADSASMEGTFLLIRVTPLGTFKGVRYQAIGHSRKAGLLADRDAKRAFSVRGSSCSSQGWDATPASPSLPTFHDRSLLNPPYSRRWRFLRWIRYNCPGGF